MKFLLRINQDWLSYPLCDKHAPTVREMRKITRVWIGKRGIFMLPFYLAEYYLAIESE